MRFVALIICVVALALPSQALAAGGPVPPSQGASITVPGSPYSFTALAAGPDTVVERLWGQSGVIDRQRRIAGSFGVAGAAYDGSSTGLSADGRTLVLAEVLNVIPPSTTRLLVLSGVTLRSDGLITLPGFFTVDAVSPTGRWLYLIHYKSQANLLDYEVRAYDLVAHRLLTKPVTDPREPDEKMTGMPMTRVVSPDGRWAYTLYQPISGKPFIHALDTERRSAWCVDVPSLAGMNLSATRLTLGPTVLRVEYGGATVALMNTRTFVVSRPAAARPSAPPAAAHRPANEAKSGSPWWLAVSALLVAALVALVVGVHRRRAPVSRYAREHAR